MDYPKRIPNVGLVGGKFVDENVSTGLPGSLIPSAWGNAVTDELLAVIKAAGLTPSEDDNAQLLQALQGLAASDVKRAVRVATTGPIALSGLQAIDGVDLAAGDRVLVKDQANASQNWIYNAAAGVWVRALDANDNAECTPGHLIIVQAGATYAGSIWQLTNTAPPQIGTTALNFVQLFGKTGVVAGSYRQVVVDALGRVTGGVNPTTLGGYGISDAYTKAQVDSTLAGKADKATTLGGYGISDAYTRAQIDSALAGKASKATTLDGYGITDGFRADWGASDYNTLNASGMYRLGQGDTANRPPGWSGSSALHLDYAGFSGTLAFSLSADEIAFRRKTPEGYGEWRALAFRASSLAGYSITDAYTKTEANNAIYTALNDYGIAAQKVSTEANLNNYYIPGKYVTPPSGLINLPPGWAQGRHTVDVTGGTNYCTQLITGASANKGRVAIRAYDGVSWTTQDITPMGIGQTWQDVTANRAFATNYTNTTGRPIQVSINTRDPSAGNLASSLYVNGVKIGHHYMTSGSQSTLIAVIPPDAVYQLTRDDTNDVIMIWAELR